MVLLVIPLSKRWGLTSFICSINFAKKIGYLADFLEAYVNVVQAEPTPV